MHPQPLSWCTQMARHVYLVTSFAFPPSLSGDTLSELAAAITCVLNRLTTYLASVSIGCQALDCLLAPIMVRTGEKLRLAGRIVEHESPKVHPWESSPRCLGYQVPLGQLDYGRLAPGGCYTVIITLDPRQNGGNCQLASAHTSSPIAI